MEAVLAGLAISEMVWDMLQPTSQRTTKGLIPFKTADGGPLAPSRDFENQVAASLAGIVKQLATGPTPPSGEGKERVLRTLIRDRLLIDTLGWPREKLLFGEIYDIYGFDLLNYLVTYVETKTPNLPRLNADAINQFERNLKRLGTCDFGFITNGHQLIGYDCTTGPSGIKVSQNESIDLEDVATQYQSGKINERTIEKLLTIFRPLKASRYLTAGPSSYEVEFGKVHPKPQRSDEIRILSTQMKSALDELTDMLVDVLRTFLGTSIPIGSSNGTGFTIWAPLDDWSTYSGRVPPTTIGNYLDDKVRKLSELRKSSKLNNATLKREARLAKRNLGIEAKEELLSELIASFVTDQDGFDTHLRDELLELIDADHVQVFARQTAHVILSRILLYRVAEDKGLVARKLSGASVDRRLKDVGGGLLDWYQKATAFRNMVDEAEKLMADVFYSHLYLHGLFDWWVVPSETKEEYDENEEAIYRRAERSIDISLEKCIRILNRFDLSEIERDIWKDVYQEYLPPKERARLGGFYTPDEIVNLILDRVGYNEAAPLCKLKVLDPACGSGTFLVEAAKRLRTHLETKKICHSDLSEIKDNRELAWRVLNKIVAGLFGLDIHPFACFLTEMNVLFYVVDLLLVAKKLEPSRKVRELSIGCDDSLRPPEQEVQLQLSQFTQTNSRAESLVKDREKARRIKGTAFDIVVGNPPWSGVLRGELSPLFDEATKALYKHYPSATDKYDIYVLFLERGIRWLPAKGHLGFITQNRYLRRRYGRGIRRFIRETCSMITLIDLWPAGPVVFPGRTNYPCITVLERM
ncbi:MAG TPA: N-6 DNA methylase [Candidatus Dormibacteraeota bacterium]|nr:N-6 DNA methylase [Candidatus Dormibacteraeota bacterium]